MQAERGIQSGAGTRGGQVDARALDRTRRRLLQQTQAPWLNEEVARRMAERLPIIKLAPDRVLDWSGPQGASVGLLQSAYPKAALFAVADAPPALHDALVPAASSWWRRWGRTTASVTSMPIAAVPEGQADLVWANMMLHGQLDPPQLMAQWRRALAVNGFLMFSTLGPGSLAELRGIYKAHRWGEPMAPLVDMHDLGDMLVEAGFADPVMDQELLTLSWAEPVDLLKELRSWGGNVAPARHAGMRTPRWRQQLLGALHGADAARRPTLTLEVVYGHAFCAPPRARVQSETSISLEAMRSLMRAPRP
jgi:malonyl-CoA O-methyltransferase